MAEWTTDQPIRALPEKISVYFREEARILLSDLKANKLEVILYPAPDPHFLGHKVRMAVKQNPYWYRCLWSSKPHFRRDRSVRALNRISRREDRNFRVGPYKYDFIYRQLILERLIYGYREDVIRILPDDEVRLFFGYEPMEDEINPLDCTSCLDLSNLPF